jgi:hypothetical protein
LALSVADQLEGELRPFGKVLQQRRARDHRAGAGLERDDVGRARAAVQAHFAQVLSRAVDAVGNLAAPVATGVAAQPAGQDQVQRVAVVALLDQ